MKPEGQRLGVVSRGQGPRPLTEERVGSMRLGQIPKKAQLRLQRDGLWGVSEGRRKEPPDRRGQGTEGLAHSGHQAMAGVWGRNVR